MSYLYSPSDFPTHNVPVSPRRQAHLRRRRLRLAVFHLPDDALEQRSSPCSDQTAILSSSSSEQGSPPSGRNRMRYTASYSPPLTRHPVPQTTAFLQSCPTSFGRDTAHLPWSRHTARHPSHMVHPSSSRSDVTSEQLGNPLVRTFIRLLMLFGIVLPLAMYCTHHIQRMRLEEPLQQLRAFARREAANNKLNDIEDLTVDGMKLYAQATCVKGPTITHVRNALSAQLRQIPQQAREDIIESAVVEGMDTVSTRQDTSADPGESGTAFSYLAYWNTKFNGNQVLVSDRYSTCIMAAGVDVKIGEDLAGYEESSRKVRIGTRPCECGMLWCVGRCPEYETVTTKRPVFKRHRLTLRDQGKLHRWMVKQAVKRAESLVLSREQLDSNSGISYSIEDGMPSASWKAPDEDYFSGDDNFADVSKSRPNPDQKHPKQDL